MSCNQTCSDIASETTIGEANDKALVERITAVPEHIDCAINNTIWSGSTNLYVGIVV